METKWRMACKIVVPSEQACKGNFVWRQNFPTEYDDVATSYMLGRRTEQASQNMEEAPVDPLSVALIGFGSTLLGNLATGVATDIAKHEFYGLLKAKARSGSIAETLYLLATGGRLEVIERQRAMNSTSGALTPEDQAELSAIASELKAASRRYEGADRESLERLGDQVSSLGQIMAWFTTDESNKRLSATRWIGPDGHFRAWTSRPWFEDFDYRGTWGRFLLLGLSACWNFNKAFEEGEGFMLYFADRFRPQAGEQCLPAQLVQKLQAFRARSLSIEDGLDTPSHIEARARLAEELGLLSAAELPRLRRYVRLVGLLENTEAQARLPVSLVEDVDAGRVRRLGVILDEPRYGLAGLVSEDEAFRPTLYLDFLMALATLAAAIDEFDAILVPGATLSDDTLKRLVTLLKTLQASYLTKGVELTTVIKVKLPLLLRELRASGVIQVDPCFCSTPDSHLRRSLQRLHPSYFNRAAGYPSLSREGVQWVEQQLSARLGAAAVAKLKEKPVQATFYEVLLTSSLVHLTAPSEPFLYDVPLFLHDMLPDASIAQRSGSVAVASLEAAVPATPASAIVEAGPAEREWWRFWKR